MAASTSLRQLDTLAIGCSWPARWKTRLSGSSSGFCEIDVDAVGREYAGHDIGIGPQALVEPRRFRVAVGEPAAGNDGGTALLRRFHDAHPLAVEAQNHAVSLVPDEPARCQLVRSCWRGPVDEQRKIPLRWAAVLIAPDAIAIACLMDDVQVLLGRRLGAILRVTAEQIKFLEHRLDRALRERRGRKTDTDGKCNAGAQERSAPRRRWIDPWHGPSGRPLRSRHPSRRR